MKLNRAELKHLIKECIVEVLEDGLGTSAGQVSEARQRPRRRPRSERQRNLPPAREPRQQRFNPALDTPIGGPAASRQNIRQAVDLTAASGIPSDIMSSILADTARTTLVEQNDHESMGKGAPQDAAGLAMSRIDPLNLPGANNWAAAAGIPDNEY